MTKRLVLQLAALAALAAAAAPATARVTPEEAAKLGKELTPVGAEAGANADGSIPAWTPIQQKGALKGEYTSDAAMDAEKPLFSITKANMAQYAKFLTEGHKKLLSTYPTYKMNVYPSHRVVTWPREVEAATKANATAATLLVAGWVAVKRGRSDLHRYFMVAAFAASALFLVGYLAYHAVHGDTKFGGVGPVRTVYLVLLASHVLLSIGIVPQSLTAFWFAWKKEFSRHTRVTRVLWPLWLYVSVTGVVVFLMLRPYYPA